MSVRSVFASGVGFVCLCPGGCVGVAGGSLRDYVCWGWKLMEEKTLEADSCNSDPTSLQANSARAWEERFLVLLRISFRVGRIEIALMYKVFFE